MNILAMLVLGVLIGWLIEWGLDWFYWRARIRAAVKTTAEENEKLHDQNSDLIRANKNLDEENADLKLHAADLQAEIERIEAAAIIGHLLDQKGNHNLQAIKGIGPAFAKRLNESGVQTFEQLSQQTPQDMERILGTLYKRFFARKNTILDQAKEYAKHIAASQRKRKA